MWDDPLPSMNVSSIADGMQPTFRGRMKRACNQISYLEMPTQELGFYQNDDVPPWGNSKQKEGEDGPEWVVRSKFEDELANFMLEKKFHTKGIGEMLDQHRKEMHEQFSPIFSTIRKIETPEPEITVLKTNTPYPSRKIRRIRACTHQRPQKIKDQYAVSRGLKTPYSRYGINIIFWKISNVVLTPINPQYAVKMDDPNITMEEYIRLEEEKAHRRGKVYNWETAMYGKIWNNEDVHDLRSVETEFPAKVFNDTLTFEVTLSCEPTVSSLNDNEIDFRISFDESDDEDCIVIFDKNSFSYKIISVNDLKTDSKNDNDKVNIPLFPSPEPTVSYFDDLDFFNDFENEFPAIVYNDALTSKSDFLTEPTLIPQHIDEFVLKSETSLSECDEEEQNALNFNDLFPFNVIYHDELKTDTDNENDKVDIKHSSGDLSVKSLPDDLMKEISMNIGGEFTNLSGIQKLLES
ncbi:hypothetical protein Tco_0775435 [Tanacetum coccineum]